MRRYSITITQREINSHFLFDLYHIHWDSQTTYCNFGLQFSVQCNVFSTWSNSYVINGLICLPLCWKTNKRKIENKNNQKTRFYDLKAFYCLHLFQKIHPAWPFALLWTTVFVSFSLFRKLLQHITCVFILNWSKIHLICLFSFSHVMLDANNTNFSKWKYNFKNYKQPNLFIFIVHAYTYTKNANLCILSFSFIHFILIFRLILLLLN